jgi:hypothetical protein
VTKATIRALARRIAHDLFTNGNGEHATAPRPGARQPPSASSATASPTPF